VDANRSMRNVKISFNKFKRLTIVRQNEIATDILKTFLELPSLQNLEVSGGYSRIPEIERICRAERSRRVRITVFGNMYLR